MQSKYTNLKKIKLLCLNLCIFYHASLKVIFLNKLFGADNNNVVLGLLKVESKFHTFSFFILIILNFM